MGILSKTFITNFFKSYKLVIALIALLYQHSSCYSNEIDRKDMPYLNKDHYEYWPLQLSRFKRQLASIEQSCKIPADPVHTTYKISYKSGTSNNLDGFVQTGSVLETTCDKGYNLITPFASNYSICVNGKWLPLLKTCAPVCPSLASTATTTVKCEYEHEPLPNCLNPVEGTRAILSCNLFYEEPTLQKNPFRMCNNGTWNPTIPACYPSCGFQLPKKQTYLAAIGAENTTIGEHPWQVGVCNSQKELICGGSILNQHVILSAAHCFTDHNGNIHPTENYFITAGKDYRRYDDDQDLFAQYSNVRKIHIPERYKGQIHFLASDIAIIILSDSFTLSVVVRPVCIELNEETQHLDSSFAWDTTVAGWGYTKEGRDLSEVLKELSVPYIPYQKCFNEVSRNFRRYITLDKICGGYINSSASVCGGDSGGALTSKNVVNERYYVRGIVSTSPATIELACDSNTYSLYTAVSYHVNFLRDILQNYQAQLPIQCAQDDCADRRTENSCSLPNFPQNGKFILLHQNDSYAPGSYVQIKSMLTLSCDTGYEVSSEHATESYCVEQGQWMPTLGNCKRVYL